MALAELAEGENRSRVIVGRKILTSLAASSLVADEDRNLAQELLSDAAEDVTSHLDAEGGDGKKDGNDREGGRP